MLVFDRSWYGLSLALAKGDLLTGTRRRDEKCLHSLWEEKYKL